MGRPSTYSPIVLPKILTLMKKGASKIEVAVQLGISRDTFYRWEKEHPEFSDTIKEGEWMSQAWWEKQGRENLMNKSFNNTLWYMNMKNRHGWSDQPKLEPEKPASHSAEDKLRDFMDDLNDGAYELAPQFSRAARD